MDDNGAVLAREPLKCLDVAGGTGDISFRIYDKAKKDHPDSEAIKITISDLNEEMLEVGKKRAMEKDIYDKFDFKVLNAEDLSSIESDSYDLYTVAFGIRNVTDRAKALSEAHRVLRPGGRFLCLEFSECQVPGFKQFYDAYSMNAIPIMGLVLARDKESYEYLV